MRYLKFVLILIIATNFMIISSAQSDEIQDLLDEVAYEYWITNDKDAAMAILDEIIELNDSISDVYAYRGSIYREWDELDTAFEEFETALELDPKSAFALSLRARVYSDLGQFTQALEDAE